MLLTHDNNLITFFVFFSDNLTMAVIIDSIRNINNYLNKYQGK